MKHQFIRAGLIALGLAMCSATTAFAADMVSVAHGPNGDRLTNAAGMTLYTFDKDQGGKSACNGPCAANWPPVTAAAGSMAMDGYSVITRDDGSAQWAYKGKPLYTWKKDAKPGDTTGDGFLNGAWHVARP